MLIGLTGAAGSGKASVGAVLGVAGWRVTAFADALRTEVAAAWGIDPRVLTVRAAKEVPTRSLAVGQAAHPEWVAWCQRQGWGLTEPRSPRWVLQQWGSWRRMTQGDGYWIGHVLVWLHHQWRTGAMPCSVVVTDVRYANEAAALRHQGGHIVQVHRPGLAPLPDDTASHESEGWRSIEAQAHIHNDGDLSSLSGEVVRAVSQLSCRYGVTR